MLICLFCAANNEFLSQSSDILHYSHMNCWHIVRTLDSIQLLGVQKCRRLYNKYNSKFGYYSTKINCLNPPINYVPKYVI